MEQNDFFVLIPTFGRAEKQITYKMLREQGYSGEIKLIVSTDDEQLADYQRTFGDDVHTFAKKDVKCDTFTNQPYMRSVLFARNEAERYAKTRNKRFYAMLDDDITAIVERYEEGGKLRRRVVGNLDAIFPEVCNLCSCKNVAVIGMGTQNMYIAGTLDYEKRLACGIIVRDTKKEIHWKSVVNEDYITDLAANKIGLYCATFPQLAFETKATGKGIVKGGMQEAYATFSKYEQSFFAVMEDPARVRVDDKMRILRMQKGGQPEIVSERWKK